MDLTELAVLGTDITVRVTPNASRNMIKIDDTGIRIYVTTAPENGKATKAVQTLLAGSLDIAKSRLTLVRGATSRDKLFRVTS